MTEGLLYHFFLIPSLSSEGESLTVFTAVSNLRRGLIGTRQSLSRLDETSS